MCVKKESITRDSEGNLVDIYIVRAQICKSLCTTSIQYSGQYFIRLRAHKARGDEEQQQLQARMGIRIGLCRPQADYCNNSLCVKKEPITWDSDCTLVDIYRANPHL